MSFIDFESGSAKERARQELREARAELLGQAEKRFNQRQEQAAKKALRGEDDWMLPSVARKLEKTDRALTIASSSASSSTAAKKSKKSKKEKKSKKSKKSKSKKRKKHSSSSDSDDGSSTADSDDEADRRRHKKRKEKRRRNRSSSSSSNSDSEADEWVESGSAQPTKTDNKPAATQRDDWMSGILIPTFSKPVQEKKKDDRTTIDSYDPAKSSRELNPFWKNGGGGLPSATSTTAASFRKPRNDSDDDEDDRRRSRGHKQTAHQASSSSSADAFRGNWRKSKPTDEQPQRSQRDRSVSTDNRSSRLTHHNSRRSRSPQKTDRKPSSRHSSSGNSTDNSRKLSRSRSPSPLTVSERPSQPSAKVATHTNTGPAPAAAAKPLTADFLTDQQMNDLGAKVLRAEIMGNTEQANALRAKLAAARAHRDTHKLELVAAARARATGGQQRKPADDEPEDVLLTATSSRGFSKPLQRTAATAPADPWGGRSARGGGKKKQTKKVDTHEAGERVRYFADDDKYDIKQMVRY